MQRTGRFGDLEWELREEHVRRYIDFTKFTLTLALGGLMFLLAFEKDYAAPSRAHIWLVHVSWFAMLGSVLAGLALQAQIVWDPIGRLESARIEFPEGPEGKPVIRVLGSVSVFERIWFWAHFGLFLAAVAGLAIFKGLNIW